MKVYVVMGYDTDSEYFDEDFVVDICRTEEYAKKVITESVAEYGESYDFWIDKWTVKEQSTYQKLETIDRARTGKLW